jgi:fucose 4-O-acetylase-like acetyltransferase
LFCLFVFWKPNTCMKIHFLSLYFFFFSSFSSMQRTYRESPSFCSWVLSSAIVFRVCSSVWRISFLETRVRTWVGP